MKNNIEKPSWNPIVLDSYWPVSRITFLGKVLEPVGASQLQWFLNEADYLEPFQSGFRPRGGTDTALVTLVDLRWMMFPRWMTYSGNWTREL